MPWPPSSAEDTDGPTVVLITDEGREIVMQRPGTGGQAQRDANRLQSELDVSGPDTFALHYGPHLR
jgi:hypothetical protein